MLTITRIDYIRKMYFEKGLNYAEIERNTGHNYRTIKKYIEMEDFNLNQGKESSSPKSYLIRPYVQEILKSDKEKKKKYRHKAKKIYEKMGSTIESLFRIEIPLMGKTTKVPFAYGKLEKRRVNKQGYITNDGCYYSVSPKYVGSYVWIKILANKIQILDNDHRLITEHARLFKKGERSIHWVDFVDIVVNRPRALKDSGFYSLLPENWRIYTNTLDNEALKEALRFLRECLVEKDMAFARQVLEENMLNGVTEPDALWTTYYRLLEDKALYQGVDASGVLPLLPTYKTSIGRAIENNMLLLNEEVIYYGLYYCILLGRFLCFTIAKYILA